MCLYELHAEAVRKPFYILNVRFRVTAEYAAVLCIVAVEVVVEIFKSGFAYVFYGFLLG